MSKLSAMARARRLAHNHPAAPAHQRQRRYSFKQLLNIDKKTHYFVVTTPHATLDTRYMHSTDNIENAKLRFIIERAKAERFGYVSVVLLDRSVFPPKLLERWPQTN